MQRNRANTSETLETSKFRLIMSNLAVADTYYRLARQNAELKRTELVVKARLAHATAMRFMASANLTPEMRHTIYKIAKQLSCWENNVDQKATAVSDRKEES